MRPLRSRVGLWTTESGAPWRRPSAQAAELLADEPPEELLDDELLEDELLDVEDSLAGLAAAVSPEPFADSLAEPLPEPLPEPAEAVARESVR